jgi:hypothetical protein
MTIFHEFEEGKVRSLVAEVVQKFSDDKYLKKHKFVKKGIIYVVIREIFKVNVRMFNPQEKKAKELLQQLDFFGLFIKGKSYHHPGGGDFDVLMYGGIVDGLRREFLRTLKLESRKRGMETGYNFGFYSGRFGLLAFDGVG